MRLSARVEKIANTLDKQAENVSTMPMKEVMTTLERHYNKKYSPKEPKKLKSLRIKKSGIDLIWA